MKPYYSTVVLTVIIIIANSVFYLLPWTANLEGNNVVDVAQVLMWLALVIALTRSTQLRLMENRISLLVFLYVLLVAIEIVLASMYFGQSLKDGIIAAREQYFYVSFFLFLLLLDDTGKIHQLLNVLTGVVLIVFALSLINYFGPTIFHHPVRSEGWGMIRAGIERAFIPGMRLASMVFIWQFARWVSMRRNRFIPGLLAIILLAQHFFSQGRGITIGVMMAAILMLFLTRQYRLLFKGGVVFLVAILVVGTFMEKNIITNVFVSSTEDVQSGSGTWEARLEQIKFSWEKFKEHPLVGNGSVALRISTFKGDARAAEEAWALAYKSDLGYTKWLKSYGIAGVLWLMAFLGIMILMSR